LEAKFKTYLKVIIPFSGRSRTKVSGEPWTMSVETIPDAEAEMSIAEIFLASGNLDDARRHLEVLATLEPGYPRASYYRGVLARITGDSEARDLFVDALLDPQLGPRAAVQLVQMGELHIPAVRTLLQKAAESGTRISDVYWALSEIYLDDLHRIEEAIRLARKVPEASAPQISVLPPDPSDTPEPAWQRYAEGKSENLKYELLSLMPDGPHVQTFVPP
jgi:tetratricopeptide (TPR) repeat protein